MSSLRAAALSLAFLPVLFGCSERAPSEVQTDLPEIVLPAFALAELPDEAFSADGFSEPREEGGRTFRVALSGGRRSITVPAWWEDDSPRPADGTNYVMEVTYRDDLDAQATLYSHGALGGYYSMSPLHRFGGEGDGQWKTARIPLSWSYIIRLADDRESTSLAVAASGDLPIERIVLRLATDEDVARHNAETRAWIARAQAEKRAALEIEYTAYDEEVPSPTPVAFPWEPMVPLMPNLTPPATVVGEPIRVRMCLNEFEPGSFGVHAAGGDLSGVDYSVSPLRTAEGVALKADVIRRTAEYAVSGKRLFPQRLWPAFPVDIERDRTHWFYFNIRTKRGETKPGVYTGTVAISSEQGKTQLPLEVEVVDIDLLTMDEAELSMGGCVSGFVPLHDLEFSADYNQNSFQIWYAGARPAKSMRSGHIELDTYYMDDYMRSASKRGVKSFVWFLGGDPYGYPDTVMVIRDLARIDKVGDENMAARVAWVEKQSSEEHRNTVVPELREPFKDWVRTVMSHAEEAGWPEPILTPFDEPAKWTQGPFRVKSSFPGVIGAGPWLKPMFKDMCALIKEAWPKTRIYASIHHNRRNVEEGIVFVDDVDVFCTNAIHEDPLLGDKVRAANTTFWQYAGTGSCGAPERALFSFGWYFASFNSRGSLAWAYNWGGWFDTTEGSNWTYAHHTPYETVPEPWFEGLREAWDVRRLIETYKQRLGDDAAAMALLNGIFEEAKASRAPGGRDTVSDFWAAVDDVGKLTNWRAQLIDRLAASK